MISFIFFANILACYIWKSVMGISWKNGGNIVEILWRYRGKYGGLWLQPWCDHKPLILGQSASQSSILLNLSSFLPFSLNGPHYDRLPFVFNHIIWFCLPILLLTKFWYQAKHLFLKILLFQNLSFDENRSAELCMFPTALFHPDPNDELLT